VAASLRKKIWGGLAGIVLIGAPIAAFHYGLNGFIERQGQDDVNSAAQRTIALAEVRINAALQSLDRLGRQGIASCAPAHLDALRRATVTASTIKDLSIVDPAGDTLCSALGTEQADYKVVASQRAAAGTDVLIEVLHIGRTQEPMIRLRRAGGGLAAMVPADLMAVQASTQGNASSKHARLMLRDGTTVASVGAEPGDEASAAGRLHATAQSLRYGIVATVSMPRADVLTEVDHLQALGIVITGLIALLILVFALLTVWAARRNPLAVIADGLEAGEFVPYYQPIVNIKTGQLRGAEVLARWRKPDGTVVPPVDFIALMESSGLIPELTRAIMRKARDEVGAAYARRPHLQLGFNLSAQQLANERIVAELLDVFDDSPVRLSQVVVEVTERQPLQDLTEARRVIAALQGIGVRIAIDDVGSGHSGLPYMLKLGADILKIDKMFVDAAGSDQNSSKIIETLVDLARKLRLDIVAEGVETFEQIVYLRDIGVSAAQGYVFAPPLPGPSFLQLVDATDPTSAQVAEPALTPARHLSARNRFDAA
jgi:sensor c-di-GMP phosphodiesterase-like protein